MDGVSIVGRQRANGLLRHTEERPRLLDRRQFGWHRRDRSLSRLYLYIREMKIIFIYEGFDLQLADETRDISIIADFHI